ncbi:MAG TPA: NAD(P)/FAD-dependent oxidoreductase [Longimicrobiales bacterium]|nr:NAD(P)/FAD-dependent oxidoreductase [Longimicrobiales bacterium]
MKDAAPEVEALIVGAGISGIGAGIELLRRGNGSFTILEAKGELGGTWRDNRYPGIAVDIPSISYCFSFETAFPWSRVYAPGAEILRYVGHCARKYGVSRHIRYRARVVRSEFDPTRDSWDTRLDDGSVITSRHLIAATGLLSQPRPPGIPGLETFAGKTMHTAQWDPDHDLSDRRVAVIGTGASAVQIVPEIAPGVTRLEVFQRTPIWISPRPDRPLRPESRLSPCRFSPIRTVMRFLSESGLELLTFSIVNYRRFPFVVRLLQRCLRFTMRRQIRDEEMAARLVPDYGLGCKRPTMSNDYLPTFNRDNVLLVTEPIERICAEGIVTRDQVLHEADTLILATGFLTTEQGNAPSFEVVGRDGVELGQFWDRHRLQAYAGVSVPGFPNFFLTAGPYSGGFNWFAALEAHLAHIMACIEGARARGVTRVEVRQDVHEAYMKRMWARAEGTVFKDRSCATANSYYIDRHGDASLPLPHTPWWRARRRGSLTRNAYDFGAVRRRPVVTHGREGVG